MYQFQAYQPVKVKDEAYERHGQAGVVVAQDVGDEKLVSVKFDVDNAIEEVEPSALEAL